MENFTLDTLTALPLFQGIGKSELTQFSTSVPHRIVQYAEGENLAEQDHPCRQLILAFRGTIGMRTRSDNNRFAFYERLQSPVALQPEALYLSLIHIYVRSTYSLATLARLNDKASPFFIRNWQQRTKKSRSCSN